MEEIKIKKSNFKIILLSIVGILFGVLCLNMFLNPEKYPPSLLYLLMTLGPAMVFMANSENLKGRIVDFFSTFGRVPFFYYVLHLYLIHTLSLLANQLAMHGFRLWVVYVVWTGIIVALYPLCRKFDQYKTRNKEKWWLSYL